MHDRFLLHTRTRRSPFWVVAFLLVVAAGLIVSGDIHPDSRARHRSSGASVAVPARPGDVATLLTNTPLAIAPQEALEINAARPAAQIPVTPARPFFLPPVVATQPTAPTAALDCMTKAIYYEAAVESDTGQRAVAQVVLNRMRSPIFPHTVCGVIFQGSERITGCQFSFTCDGSLARQPSLSGWMRARRAALAALSGHVERSVGLATHYHADYVVPYWASSLDKTTTIGAHIFYTMRGGLGRPGGFVARYDALGEAAPAAAPSAESIVQEAIDGTGAAAALVPVKPRDRTNVIEDALGTALPAAPSLPAPVATLKADERRGELAIDKTRGTLNR